MKATVTVMLKHGVLDPQGKAIAQALHHLGFAEVGEVRAGKVIELELAGTDPEAARLERLSLLVAARDQRHGALRLRGSRPLGRQESGLAGERYGYVQA